MDRRSVYRTRQPHKGETCIRVRPQAEVSMILKLFLYANWGRSKWWLLRFAIIIALIPMFRGASYAQTGSFDAGSNGSDGALNLTTPGTIIFDPRTFNPPL